MPHQLSQMKQKFGRAMRSKRLERGLTLQALSAVVGVSFAYLARIERGDSPPPPPQTLEVIAHALKWPRKVAFRTAEQVRPELSRQFAINQDDFEKFRRLQGKVRAKFGIDAATLVEYVTNTAEVYEKVMQHLKRERKD